MLLKKPLLVLGERASHEGDNARQSRLVDIETIEESFDDNYGLAVIHGPAQIEEDQRFPEPGRKTISRFGLANRSSCVSDKAAIKHRPDIQRAYLFVASTYPQRFLGTKEPEAVAAVGRRPIPQQPPQQATSWIRPGPYSVASAASRSRSRTVCCSAAVKCAGWVSITTFLMVPVYGFGEE